MARLFELIAYGFGYVYGYVFGPRSYDAQAIADQIASDKEFLNRCQEGLQ